MPQGRFHSDKSGNRYGMLTLVCRLDEKTANGSFKYLVQCDCGESKAVGFSQMTRGHAKSCGCLQRRKGEDSPAYKHGRSQTKEYDLELHMKRQYGLGFVEYNKMLEKQNGVCAICGKPMEAIRRRMNIDHCHDTNEVRGILCSGCNTGLGHLGDNVAGLQRAIAYLQNPPFKNSLAR